MGIRRIGRERGAALVEMALTLPILLLMVLGIIEFGWLLGQYNDVRHGAREGARYAAVNGLGSASSNDIRDLVCSSMEGLSAGMTEIRVNLTLDPDGDSVNSDEVGENAGITVEADLGSLSDVPLISNFLPTQLSSSVEFRLEQPPTWSTASTTCP